MKIAARAINATSDIHTVTEGPSVPITAPIVNIQDPIPPALPIQPAALPSTSESIHASNVGANGDDSLVFLEGRVVRGKRGKLLFMRNDDICFLANNGRNVDFKQWKRVNVEKRIRSSAAKQDPLVLRGVELKGVDGKVVLVKRKDGECFFGYYIPSKRNINIELSHFLGKGNCFKAHNIVNTTMESLTSPTNYQ